MLKPNYFLYTHPRLLNKFHSVRIFSAHTQTHVQELKLLQKYSEGKKLALEIGSYMGVSAVAIAKKLAPEGNLYCVDPYVPKGNKINPCLKIFNREIRRNRVTNKVTLIQGYSFEVKNEIPPQLDFIFIDGDHTYQGIQKDWELVKEKLSIGGVACLHDTNRINNCRVLDSVRFFDEVISQDKDFNIIDSSLSLNILSRKN